MPLSRGEGDLQPNEGKHPGYKYGRKGTAGGSWGRLPSPQSLLVVVVDQLLDVAQLLVKVLETGVGLLTPRIRLGPKELLLDLELHLLEIKSGEIKGRHDQMAEKVHSTLVVGCCARWLPAVFRLPCLRPEGGMAAVM